MSVQVDIEGRKITATVADLVDLPERRDWVRGVSQAARARLGIRAHTRYRSQRAAQYDSFRAEVPVVLQRQVDGFAATVGGRVDGWLSEGATTVLEEAKSVALTGDELAAVELDQISAFAFQLRLYGLAVRQQQPGHPLTARLVLLSLLDGEQRTVAVPLQPQATRRGLDARLREAIGQSHAAAERRARLARCAEALRFPYARLRDGQQPLLDTIQDGLESFRPVLAQAATGTGKTVCALLAALRFSLPRAAPVWFVTAKNTQQQLAAETFLDLCRRASLSAADLNAVTVRAKLAMCPPEHRLCHPDLCPYLHRFDERLAESELLDDLLEHHLHLAPDLIYQRSATCSLCPFEVTLALTGRAQLVIADYNYLYDGPPSQIAAPW